MVKKTLPSTPSKIKYWNYRVVHHLIGGYGIHEVYYNSNDEPISMTERSVGVSCEEDKKPMLELPRELARMFDAFTKPILPEFEIGYREQKKNAKARRKTQP